MSLLSLLWFLGPIAITAALEFLNVSTDSHIAAVKGTGAAFKASRGRLAYSKKFDLKRWRSHLNILSMMTLPLVSLTSMNGVTQYSNGLTQKIFQGWIIEDCISVWEPWLIRKGVSSFNSPTNTDYIAEYIRPMPLSLSSRTRDIYLLQLDEWRCHRGWRTRQLSSSLILNVLVHTNKPRMPSIRFNHPRNWTRHVWRK